MDSREIITTPVHTPGPWNIALDLIGSPVIKSANYRVAHVAWCGLTMGDWHKGGERVEKIRTEIAGNARLIAAAPTMLEALKVAQAEILNHMDGTLPQFVIAAKMIDAAVAKAEGR